ncbi:MAG: hypothetical protein ACLTSD_04315 [Eubacterium sp.]
MKNAMQLKVVIKNISPELHIKRQIPDSGNGGLRYPCYYGYGCNKEGGLLFEKEKR